MGNILSKYHLPGETIGIIGGGQLGQMMSSSAKEKGYKVIILDPTNDCPAAQVSDEQIIAEYDDFDSLKKLAEKCDVLTYEFENVDAETIEEIQKYTDIPQGTRALTITQNRRSEKDFLIENEFPVVPNIIVRNEDDFFKALNQLGYPSILKTVEGGYDGKGQILIQDDGYDKDLVHQLIKSSVCILESKIFLKKEVSVVISSNSKDQHSVFPIIENEHRNNILHISNCPARVSEEIKTQAYEIARSIAKKLSLVGTMCIEFFVSESDELFVNEIAPRPHNSGHLTIESCNISQFDAHIRGICGWKMPQVKQFSPAIMVNLLGQHLDKSKNELTEYSNWNFHDYGKYQCKLNRKMGHITILTDDIDNEILKLKNNPIWND